MGQCKKKYNVSKYVNFGTIKNKWTRKLHPMKLIYSEILTFWYNKIAQFINGFFSNYPICKIFWFLVQETWDICLFL